MKMSPLRTIFPAQPDAPKFGSSALARTRMISAAVCKALEISNPTKAVTQLDDDEHTTLTFSDGRPGHGAQKFNIISESGLYALIIWSNKPAAREFRKWITSEVLPAIRRNGAYAMPQGEFSDPEDDPAKRSSAELVEQINRCLAAGENIPLHVLQYVSNIARVASGIWYRDNFGIDGRSRKLLPGEVVPLLPNFTPDEDRAARRILKIIRRYGKCTMRHISVNFGKGLTANERMRIITAMVNAGILQAEGIPGASGTVFRT